MGHKIPALHTKEFTVIGILLIIGLVAIASFVLTTGDLTRSQIQGRASAVAVNPGDWYMFLEDRTTGLNNGPFTVRLFINYLGVIPYESKGEVKAECYVDNIMDSPKIIVGTLRRDELRTVYVSGNAVDDETRVRCDLLYKDTVLESTGMIYSVN